MINNDFTHHLNSLAVNKITYYDFHECVCNEEKPMTTIGFLLKGNAEFYIENNVIELKEGQIFFIPKGAKYIARWHGYPKIKLYSAVCGFAPDFPENGNIFLKIPLQCTDPTEKSDKKAFKRLYSAFSEGNYYEALSVFYSVYADIFQRLTATEEKKHKSPVCNSVKFINENCCADFDVKQLAKLSGMSESRFYELFKEHTGYTPMEYKNKQRVNRAAIMLSDRNNTVEAISEQLNFSSPAYFRRVFKAVTGKTPKEYRKNCDMI